MKESENKKVVGITSLNVNSSPRLRHSGSLGISVHAEYQSMGIGKKINGRDTRFSQIVGLC
ncbi:GNAT family N-acetyltransferase [Paraclostridium bifermentans]|nr:GNAT family N-acetyltransferase [Paraclostridium bifermentans]